MENRPSKGNFLEILLRSSKTVFSVQDVALLWGESESATITNRLKKYIRAGKLLRVRHGLYAKDENYDRYELATRIYTPSYIGFETVLTREGVSFQYYGNIFVASYLNREIEANGQKINYVRMKSSVLSDTTGIDHRNGVAWATKERAFLDRLYVTKEYYFDSLNVLDWDKVFEILPVYGNKRLEKQVRKFHRNFINTK
ncbi:MAG: type IV toxin-antitoxin system AbiEi family antitoxin domain-containing protein [Candidatus Moranbacteria bacterium]|nr:type IV toxin-antitoxin system AbiEi family antitoxin domain-containing protein [Candidatus Moranbacteria bacterium]